ncbi:hypothetical protein ACFE04_004925 [Oxalis oulophora]
MDEDLSSRDIDNVKWTTDDELEIDNFTFSPSPSLTPPHKEVSGEESSSVGSSGTKLMDNFIGMGFSSDLVVAAIKENGEENANLILETLLKQSACSSASSSNSKVVDHFIGMGFSKEMVLRAIQENGEENTDSILETLLSYMEISTYLSEDEKKVPESDKEKKLLCLVSMGYPVKEAAKALKQCGLDANLEVLTDWLSAAPGARTDDAPIAETDDDAPMAETDDAPVAGTDDSHMARTDDSNLEVSADCLSAATVDETDDALVSGTDDPPVAGTDDAHANLEALTDCLSAAPMTGTDDALMAGTDDALVAGTDDALVARADDAPDIEDEKPIKPQTSSDDRKRKNDDEPDELEMLLGFPKNHTRGGGICKTDRYKSLGNSFQ